MAVFVLVPWCSRTWTSTICVSAQLLPAERPLHLAGMDPRWISRNNAINGCYAIFLHGIAESAIDSF